LTSIGNIDLSNTQIDDIINLALSEDLGEGDVSEEQGGGGVNAFTQ